MDDEKIEINSQEHSCTGDLKSLHAPHRNLHKMQKNENLYYVMIVVKLGSNEPKRTTQVILTRIV